MLTQASTDVIVREARLQRCVNGGASVQGGYVIENTIISDNGSGVSNVGGVLLVLSNGVFRFNTVAGNVAASTRANGVRCGTGGTRLLASIIFANRGGGPELNANCAAVSSFVEGAAADPLLDADFHLQDGSPAIDACGATGPGHDVDGDVRPRGAAFDCGADEHD